MKKKSNFKEFLRGPTGEILLTVTLYIFSFMIITFLGALTDKLNGAGKTTEIVVTLFSLFIFAVWIYFGWKSLSVIQPQIFLIMPIVGWIFYFAIKGILSVVVGIFTTPYQIANTIRNKL